MKYILMMSQPYDQGCFRSRNWKPEEFEAHMAHMHELNRELIRRGEMVAVEALSPPSESRFVSAGKGGVPAITDGPFPETKEFLAGYWIVDVETPERAYEIAARASAAPGEGGAPLDMPLEVRRVMSIGVPEL